MEAIVHFVESGVIYFAKLGCGLCEIAGIIVLLFTAATSFIRYFRHDERVQLRLAEGISLALQFKLGAEVLRTVVVREFSELIVLGAIIVLRGVLTLILHWEISREEAKHQVESEKTEAPEKAEKSK